MEMIRSDTGSQCKSCIIGTIERERALLGICTLKMHLLEQVDNINYLQV